MSNVQSPVPEVQTNRRFVGIDLAGDSGVTGVAIITEGKGGTRYSFPSGNWKGVKGLQSLKELIQGSVITALDQPFSFSAGMMRLLTDLSLANGDADASDYCSRTTDTGMRAILATYGLASDYVMSPNRCQNIWRALALAKKAGFSRSEVCKCTNQLIETHPRVAWTVALGHWIGRDETRRFIEMYKGERWSDADSRDSRKLMLETFEAKTAILPVAEDYDAMQALRAEAWDSVDKFEALICAYVAFLHSRGKTVLAGFVDPAKRDEFLELEGAAVLPRLA